MRLIELLKQENILLDFKAKAKTEVLAALVGKVAGDFDRQAVLAALREREELGSTGIGYGVAVPHVRLSSITEPLLIFGRSREPVEFEAMDEQPCSLFFMVIGPAGRDVQESYLKVMAKISRIMRNAVVRDALGRAGTADEVIRLLDEQDH